MNLPTSPVFGFPSFKSFLILRIQSRVYLFLIFLFLLGPNIACNRNSAKTNQANLVKTGPIEFVQQGIAKSRQGDFQGATRDFTKAVEKNPNDVNAYFNRGFAYSQLGKFKLALGDFSRALELDAKLVEAYVNRGNVYLHLGKDEQAITNYVKALKLNPNDAFAYNNLGLAYLNL
ncbi:MAG: tetratricopeptide repeat protein, partial [cyanobacterium endosymbiont of Rhopalodia yunnanensis]